MPPEHRQPGWAACNRWLYRLGHAMRRVAGAGRLGRSLGRSLVGRNGGLRVLYVANGRLGDSLLAAAFTARYQRFFGAPIVAIGRPEAAVVLARHVDQFVPFAPARLGVGGADRERLAAALSGGFDLAFSDVHLAHGGEDLAELLDRVPADRKLVSAGLGWPEPVLPRPSLPATADVLPGLAGKAHLWQHLTHHHRQLGERLGRPFPLPDGLLSMTPEVPRQPLPPDFIGCQPTSAQPKKDWPWQRWCELFATCPTRNFVLLGHPSRSAIALPDHVLDLRGKTSLPEALAIAGLGAAFVGVDSGLTHAAAIARCPTVCVMPSTAPGLFFPYPAELQRPHFEVVRDARFSTCAGCQGLCQRAPLWRTLRYGWPCLADLPVAAVRAALDRAIAATAVTECATANRC